jgi:hypothetical protein
MIDSPLREIEMVFVECEIRGEMQNFSAAFIFLDAIIGEKYLFKQFEFKTWFMLMKLSLHHLE